MAITDIQFSEELETDAPSIKYRGNEGPKSPQEEQMMADALLKEEYDKYVYDLLEQRPDATPMSFEEFRMMVIGEGQLGSAQPPMANRQMAAFGGIMGVDGRKRYFGGSIKDRVRKLIPNEVADVAVKAAPFVAPFNAPLAGLMAGVGSFDQTGKIGSSLAKGLGTYGMGKVTSGILGGGYQGGKTLNPFNTQNWTSPIGKESGIGQWWDQKGKNLFKEADLPTSGNTVGKKAPPV